jgi:hypothetical protein
MACWSTRKQFYSNPLIHQSSNQQLTMADLASIVFTLTAAEDTDLPRGIVAFDDKIFLSKS